MHFERDGQCDPCGCVVLSTGLITHRQFFEIWTISVARL